MIQIINAKFNKIYFLIKLQIDFTTDQVEIKKNYLSSQKHRKLFGTISGKLAEKNYKLTMLSSTKNSKLFKKSRLLSVRSEQRSAVCYRSSAPRRLVPIVKSAVRKRSRSRNLCILISLILKLFRALQSTVNHCAPTTDFKAKCKKTLY